MIPKTFHALFRREFRKRLNYSVMLDWDGSIVKQFGYRKGVANVYVIDCNGVVTMRISGPATEEMIRKLFLEFDWKLKGKP